MRFPLALVTFLLTLAFAGPAFATTVVFPNGAPAQPYQSWADHSFVPTPPGTVVVNLAPCPASPDPFGGCTMLAQRAIYLGAASHDKATFLHELGHVFDQYVMTDPMRAQFESAVHRHAAWIASATDPPREQFAEAYSLCARQRTIRAIAFEQYGYTPTPAMQRRACAVIRSAAAAPALTAPTPG